MDKYGSGPTARTWFMALLLSALAAGCGDSGGRDPILGTGAALPLPPPTVTAVTPLANATGVPINTKIITAAFSKAMAPATLTTTSFTLACAGIPITGGGPVTYLAAGSVATLPLPLATNLPPTTACTATVTTAATDDATGFPLASNFVWTFTTGVTPDATRPTVTLTLPATTIPGPTPGVPTNTAIIAIFSEDMAPATISAASFTVTCAGPCVSPAGTVAYSVGARTATFTPAAVLAAGTTYTATIIGVGAITPTTPATDLALNALAGNQAPPLPAASNYVWTFTTAAPVPPTSVSVLSTSPAAGAGSVCPNATINATFTVPSGLRMDPLTVVAGTTFTVTGPAGAVAGTVALDGPTGRIATFTPTAVLAAGTYTATIVGGDDGVKDLAIPANTLAAGPVSNPWTFTVGAATGACLGPLALGTASTFGSLTCAALTGSTAPPTGTTVNGNIGTTATSTSITNFVGGGAPATPGIVNGTIFASDLPTPGNTTSATAIGDANTARLAGETAGASGAPVTTADLGAQAGFGPAPGTFLPGAYQSGSSMAISTPITLDAQGDANAVWVFFPASTLTTSGTGNVLLANGAQAKNVFWVVGSAATLGAPTFNGNILAGTAITVATVPTTVNGRLLTSGPSCAAVTFDANLHTVNVPAP